MSKADKELSEYDLIPRIYRGPWKRKNTGLQIAPLRLTQPIYFFHDPARPLGHKKKNRDGHDRPITDCLVLGAAAFYVLNLIPFTGCVLAATALIAAGILGVILEIRASLRRHFADYCW